jgi:hypothetical protein
MNRTNHHMTLTDPNARLAEMSLTTEEKRELVAHWISDIHAVPDYPALRRLPDGTFFHIDQLTEVLGSIGSAPGVGAVIIPFARVVPTVDDDDPSPGASSAWPTLPPVVIDARAAIQPARRAGTR